MSNNPKMKSPSVESSPVRNRTDHSRGLLKSMIEKYSSTPLPNEDLTEDAITDQTSMFRYDAALTQTEREYLSSLLVSGNVQSMESASKVLQDKCVFPTTEHDDDDDSGARSLGGSSSSSNSCNVGKEEGKEIETSTRTSSQLRNSVLQQQLFRLHETTNAARFHLAHQNSILASDNSVTHMEESSDHSPFRIRSLSPPISYRNIVLEEQATITTPVEEIEQQETDSKTTTTFDFPPTQTNSLVDVVDYETAVGPTNKVVDDDKNQEVLEYGFDAKQKQADDEVNPFEDIHSWLDGSQGVEVRISENSEQTAPNSRSPTLQPFRILGTSANDTSCHPHVLSPPLMESLLAFVPESYYSAAAATAAASNAMENTPCVAAACGLQDTTDDTEFKVSSDTVKKFSLTTDQSQLQTMTNNTNLYNFYLKYSLVRDGPGLWSFLRQVRASTLCFLAIETDSGHVFGAFTSHPWRLSKGWYGSQDTFLWKLRRSRLETAGNSIAEQVCQESEIQVFPYRTGNAAIQYCSKKCLMLGQGEIIPSPVYRNAPASDTGDISADETTSRRNSTGTKIAKHYGYALYLDKNLQTGTTSSSETFGNPCLIDDTRRGAKFTVANIEVWTLTQHDTVAAADQSELSNLFLDGGRDSKRLNFMNILVGGPI
jgi:TLD